MTIVWDEKETATIHMIGTQLTWDAADNGRLNGMEIMGDGRLIVPPMTIKPVAMPDPAYKALMQDMGLDDWSEL